MERRRVPQRRVLAAAALAALLVASPASAWDQMTHVSLVRAAWQISPDAETHTPQSYRDALLEAVANADPLDPDCKQHAVPREGAPDAASRAEKLLQQLLADKGSESAYRRAQLVGRYLHFVADAAMPAVYAGLRGGSFFSGADFVVFREVRLLSEPLAEALREAALVPAADPRSTSARSAAFRVAANLLADALLRLPKAPPPEGTDGHAPPEPAVLFASYGTPLRESALARAPASLPERAGLHVVEWTRLTSGTVRVLLLNNESRCVTRVKVESEGWSRPLSLTLAPLSAQTIELEAPDTVTDPRQVRGSFDVFACAGPYAPDQGVRGRRLATPSTTAVPGFETFMEVEPPRERKVPALLR